MAVCCLVTSCSRMASETPELRLSTPLLIPMCTPHPPLSSQKILPSSLTPSVSPPSTNVTCALTYETSVYSGEFDDAIVGGSVGDVMVSGGVNESFFFFKSPFESATKTLLPLGTSASMVDQSQSTLRPSRLLT